MKAFKDGNLIYCSIYGTYTDDDSITLTSYLNEWFAGVDGPVIRVWDMSQMSNDQYQLTTTGVNQAKLWADDTKKKWPGSLIYIISGTSLVFGMARMYELKASDNHMSITVVKEFDELPEGIKARIGQ